MSLTAAAPPTRRALDVEWLTLGLILACHAGLAAAVCWLWAVAPVLALLVVTVLMVLHSSLTHEALHGHPFRSRRLNEALMSVPVGLFVPYARFRDLHLAHHRDANLTDPYDDPESNFLDPEVWDRLPGWRRALLGFNNTLFGRITIGGILGQVGFMIAEAREIRAGAPGVARVWLVHLAGVAAVLWLVSRTPMPLWAYGLCAVMALSVLRIRTFLEHRAHEKSRARSVIVEDRGLLAFLFLNNNLHAVHHMNPNVPWYALPALYRSGRDRFLAYNGDYRYRSYGEVFRRHFWRAKDPVPHPLWRRRG